MLFQKRKYLAHDKIILIYSCKNWKYENRKCYDELFCYVITNTWNLGIDHLQKYSFELIQEKACFEKSEGDKKSHEYKTLFSADFEVIGKRTRNRIFHFNLVFWYEKKTKKQLFTISYFLLDLIIFVTC